MYINDYIIPIWNTIVPLLGAESFEVELWDVHKQSHVGAVVVYIVVEDGRSEIVVYIVVE